MKNKHLTLRLYRDKKREFRWTLIASNGRKLADSGEGYKRRGSMEKAIVLVLYGICEVSFWDVLDRRDDIRMEDTIPHGKK